MAEVSRLPHSDPAHPFREVTLFLHDELPAGEKAAFERHLRSCPHCQESVEVGRKLFPAVYEAVERESYLRLLEAAETEWEGAPPRRPWWALWPWLFAAVALAAATVFTYERQRPVQAPRASSGQPAVSRPGTPPVP